MVRVAALTILALIAGSAGLAPSITHADAILISKEKVRSYRRAHERQIVSELVELLALRNVADSVADIERNAAFVAGMLRQRGFTTRIFSAGAGTPPAVFGELLTRGARRTVVFYAHMDGQPADTAGWLSDPWTPIMRLGPPAPNNPPIDWGAHDEPMNPEWRLYARAASDDKGPIVALVAAIDALRAAGQRPSVNVKVFIEGEEEQGSPHLPAILTRHRELLDADAWILCDGPVHQSGRPQVLFGARGVLDMELIVYGPARPLHSGHYGNWAPNPAVMLAHLVAAMRSDDGKVLIGGFYDDVRPLTAAEQEALAELPPVEATLKNELGLARTELSDRLLESTMSPALNVRGISAGNVGAAANNSVPSEARLSIDFRLVPEQSPQRVRALTESFLRDRGWFLASGEPQMNERLQHPRIASIGWSSGYAAQRTDIDLPVSRAVIASLERWTGMPLIKVPMSGGSVPMSVFATALDVPVLAVPTVNHDNNQHAANENLRLQNLWDGIELYAALIADLNW